MNFFFLGYAWDEHTERGRKRKGERFKTPPWHFVTYRRLRRAAKTAVGNEEDVKMEDA